MAQAKPASQMIKHLANPVRSKIFIEIAKAQDRGEDLTAKQLLQIFPQVAQPTMYRHLKVLLEDNILAIAREIPIRGVVEKAYIISPHMATDMEAIIHSNDGPGYLGLFTQFMAIITEEFVQYAAQAHIHIIEDMPAFSVAPVHATNEELVAALTQMGESLMPLIQNQPSPERKMRNIYTILGPPQK